jgi:hypothetical protein
MTLRRLILSAVLLTNTLIVPNAQPNSSSPASTFKLLTNTSFAQNAELNSSGFDSSYQLTLRNAVQDKNFYLLSLFQQNPEVRKLISEDKALRKLSNDKRQASRMAVNCNEVGCFDRLFRFSGPTIETVATKLKPLAKRPQFKMLVKDMRRSGAFIKYSRQSDAEMLMAAWKDAANGINRLLRIYCLGKDPFYKDIDRISFDVSSEAYRKLLKLKMTEIKFSKDPLFFEPTLNFALKLLEANRRDEAGRYEPLEEGENKACLQNIKKIRWSDYPYSFILVLGSGPQDSATRLSPIGAKRADQAAQLFLQHSAPLIILSGGHVHPMQTPYCEAIEMKKYVMEKFKIPERSILIEPHARHTTTNFRNASRLAFRYGIPAELKALVTSSEDHIAITTKDGFRIRCSTELGYFPMEFITRISPVAAEFKPAVASLFFDANDPLDP